MSWGEKYPYEFYPPTANFDKAKELLALALEEEGLTFDQIPPIEFLTDDRPDRKLPQKPSRTSLTKPWASSSISSWFTPSSAMS